MYKDMAMRKWIALLTLVAPSALAQSQCEAYKEFESGVEMQFIPHLAAPPNAYAGISYSGDQLLQVASDDLSGRKAKLMQKGETCECMKLLVDNCKTVYVPTNGGVFTIWDAAKRGIVFVVPPKK